MRDVIIELEEMGVPVMDDKRHGSEFWINAESEKASGWLSFHNGSKTWGDWRVNDKLHEVLDKYGYFCEWENSAILLVHKNSCNKLKNVSYK